MVISETYVRARIDAITKERATNALEAMGLTVSDVIRILMLRIAEEHKLPFEIKVPNKLSMESRTELEKGHGKKVANISSLIAELHARN